jgi:hypothetical protein
MGARGAWVRPVDSIPFIHSSDGKLARVALGVCTTCAIRPDADRRTHLAINTGQLIGEISKGRPNVSRHSARCRVVSGTMAMIASALQLPLHNNQPLPLGTAKRDVSSCTPTPTHQINVAT